MLSILDEKAQEDEALIIKELLSCIDCKKSLVFNAGAGAGKTYALKLGVSGKPINYYK